MERKVSVEVEDQYIRIMTWRGDERPLILQVKIDDEGIVADLISKSSLVSVFHETYEELQKRIEER